MQPSVRLALHYVLLFGVTGVSLPFAGLWLKSLGLDGAEIGTLLAVPMLARFLTGPMIAVWADGFQEARPRAQAKQPQPDPIALHKRGSGDNLLSRDRRR